MNKAILKPIENMPGVTQNIRNILNDYILDHDLDSLIIGVSGGADSALVCALAEPVCKALKIPLIGRSLPASTNKTDEVDRAKLVGDAFCDDFKEVSIEKEFKCLDAATASEEWAVGANTDHRDRVRKGNIKARVRMVFLRDLAFRRQGIVLGTDNLTEYLLGFWTLDGDVGDIGLIQNMWKSEVYGLMQFLRTRANIIGSPIMTEAQKNALLECERANPTDGLGVSNSDLDQLGEKCYADVDRVLKEWLRAKDMDLWARMADIMVNPVVQRHERSHFKRNNPYNITREMLLA